MSCGVICSVIFLRGGSHSFQACLCATAKASNQQSILSNNALAQCHVRLKPYSRGSHINSFLAKATAYVTEIDSLQAVTHAIFDNR